MKNEIVDISAVLYFFKARPVEQNLTILFFYWSKKTSSLIREANVSVEELEACLL